MEFIPSGSENERFQTWSYRECRGECSMEGSKVISRGLSIKYLEQYFILSPFNCPIQNDLYSVCSKTKVSIIL